MDPVHQFAPRLDLDIAAPGAEDAMSVLDEYVSRRLVERPLLELVRLRASQINGCTLCLGMHARDARAAGVAQRRLDVLAAWRGAPDFSPRERAALAWAEPVTLVAAGQVPDEVHAVARAEFTDDELATLTLAIIAINGWNRLAISLRMQPSGEAATAA